MRKLLLFIVLLLLPCQVWAESITNPQIVSEMKAEIVQESSIDLTGSVDIVELNFSIPQEDKSQIIDSLEVYSNGNLCRGDCSYDFVFDSFGNRNIRIVWKSPESHIDFEIKTLVTVKIRKSLEKRIQKEFISPTSLVQSADQEIADLASEARGTDFEKVAFLSKWIYQNIKYDKVFSDINISAKDILRTRRGVCDEFSNLLVSFLRNLGYHSGVAVGYVYPGRVYGGEEFQPHGWTEVYVGDGIVADPTWTEVGYLDATHIKFGVYPDSNWIFGNLIARGSLSIKAELGKITTDIKVLDFKEEPVVETSSTFLEETVWREYAVMKTDLLTEECVLTRINVKSCVDRNGNDILVKTNTDDIVYFCGKKTYFSILKIPNTLSQTMKYDCKINVMPYAGDQEIVPLEISFKMGNGVKLFTDKTVVTPDEKILVNAPQSHIFTDLGNYGFNTMKISAPYKDFTVYAYKSGYISEQPIKVVSEKPFEIHMTAPDNATAGKPIPVEIGIENLRNGEQVIELMFRNEKIIENIKGTTIFNFNFTPTNKEDNLIQVFVSTLHYSASESKLIVVEEERGILEFIISGIKKLLDRISIVLTSLFIY